MLCFLAATRQPHLAICWVIAILGCTGVISGLKLVLDACGNPLAGAGLTSPSGHTAMSAVVYGGFAAVIGARLARPARAALIAGAACAVPTWLQSDPLHHESARRERLRRGGHGR